ncbi:MAG: NADH-quinone oxidoreductase subunit H [Candidatus Omnitrophota bacterium]
MIKLNDMIMVVVEGLLLILIAPLISGVIRKIKNVFRMRKGQSVLQPYYNIRKLFLKDEVISKNVSWIFYAAPVIVFAGSVTALLMVVAINPRAITENTAALFIAVFFVLGIGRFFLALAGLDAGSSFGGMGSSREMFISSFVEPAIFITVFVLCMGGGGVYRVSALLAGAALFMAVIAETSRVPVDNQETHLELTMIHEAMVLEYSGRSLALIELASHIKQIALFTVLSWYLFPYTIMGMSGYLSFPVKIAAICLAVAVVEISVAKMRLFRAVDFLSFSFFIAIVASIAAILGL